MSFLSKFIAKTNFLLERIHKIPKRNLADAVVAPFIVLPRWCSPPPLMYMCGEIVPISGYLAPGSSPHYRHNFWLTCRSSPATLRLQGHQSTIHCLPFSHLHHDDIWKVISIYLYNVRGTVSEYYPDVALSCNVLMDAMIMLYQGWSLPYIFYLVSHCCTNRPISMK